MHRLFSGWQDFGERQRRPRGADLALVDAAVRSLIGACGGSYKDWAGVFYPDGAKPARLPFPLHDPLPTATLSRSQASPKDGMTEKQIRARIERMHQLIAGVSKEYMQQRYAIGLHAHGGFLSSYAIHIGNAY